MNLYGKIILKQSRSTRYRRQGLGLGHAHRKVAAHLQSSHRHRRRLRMVGVVLLCMLMALGSGPHTASAELILETTQYSNYENNDDATHDPYQLPPFYCPAPLLRPFFAISRFIMSAVVGSEPLPPGYTDVINSSMLGIGPKVRQYEWLDLIAHNWAINLIVMIFVAIAILVPIFGLYVCISECFQTGNEHDVHYGYLKGDSTMLCRGHTLLGILTLGILFGFVAAFVSSNWLELSEKDYETAMQASLYYATATRQLNRNLVGNYTQMANLLQYSLYRALHDIKEELIMHSMENSRRFVKHYTQHQPKMSRILADMTAAMKVLHHGDVQLIDVLRGVRRQCIKILLQYGVDNNKKNEYIWPLRKYGLNIIGDYGIRCNSMRIYTTINRMKEYIDNTPIIQGINETDKIVAFIMNVSTELDNKLKNIVDGLNAATRIIKNVAREVQLEMLQDIDMLTTETVMDDLHSEYVPYRFCIGIVAGSVLLLIGICLLCALICGIFGGRSRNQSTTNRLFNRYNAELFLIAAAALIFAFAPLLALSALGHFLPGIIAHRVYCDTTEAGNRQFDFMIVNCRKNQSIFSSLDIKGKCQKHIQDFKDYNVKIKTMLLNLRYMDMRLEEEQPTISKLMSDADLEKLKKLRESHALLDFQEGRFVNPLKTIISPKSIRAYIDNQFPTIDPLLQHQMYNLYWFQGPVVNPLYDQYYKLKDLSLALRDLLIHEHHSMQESLDLLKYEHDKALEFEAKTKGWAYFIDDTLGELTTSVIKFFDRHTALSLQGNCYELSTSYDKYRHSICCSFVDLISGFWLAVLWCLLLFLPILFISVRLADIYHRHDPYPDPYADRAVTSQQQQQLLSEQRRSSYLLHDSIVAPPPREPIDPPPRTISERRSRPLVRQREGDINRSSVRRRRSHSSVSSPSSSDQDVAIRKMKSKHKYN